MAKVRHTIFGKGKTLGYFNSDLIFIKDIPHIVLLWTDYPNGKSEPAYTVAIDSAKLHPLNWPDVQFLYELPIELPDEACEKLRPYLGPNL